jgi:hypothetical protein
MILTLLMLPPLLLIATLPILRDACQLLCYILLLLDIFS